MRDQVRFDFLCVDLLAAAVDEVLDSSLDDEIPGRIKPHKVAGAIESIGGERFPIAFGRAEVAANGVRTAAPQFADRAGRSVGTVGLNDPDLIGWREWTTLRRECDFFALVETRVAQQSLSHSEHLLHDKVREGAL